MKELNSRGDDGSITGMSDGSLSHNYCVKFQKEAINLSRLDHPNIVRVTDSFSENGTFYYVMDYIEGQNLNDYVKSHHIDEAEAVSIIKSVADALIYMHEAQHMLHLDLKPGNVMRRESDGHIFLIDFGLSKHFDGNGQPETSTTIGLGTVGYAPIEQGNRAKNGEFRPTIDVYALGATLYKLLTRETPPPASDLVSDEDLLEDNLRAKDVSDDLIKVVSQAMCPSVKKRTQTIRDFNSNLDGVKADTQVTNGDASKEAVVEADKDETIVASAKGNSNIKHGTEETSLASPAIPKQERKTSWMRKILGSYLEYLEGLFKMWWLLPSYIILSVISSHREEIYEYFNLKPKSKIERYEFSTELPEIKAKLDSDRIKIIKAKLDSDIIKIFSTKTIK